MKHLVLIFGLIMCLSFCSSCDDEETFQTIPTSYLDVSSWNDDYLLPYDDTSYGYDFSEEEHNNTSRDCYLSLDGLSIVNSFLFEGENHIKKYSAADISMASGLNIPTEWDNSPTLEANSFYLIECTDGYALVKLISSDHQEWIMNFIFIPESAINSVMTKA